MKTDPYRSAPAEPRNNPPAELFYAPVITRMLAPGFVPFVVCVLLGGVSGAATDHAATGIGIGVVVGTVSAMAWRRRTDAMGISLRVDGGKLAVRRGRSGQRLANAPLEDLLDVKIDTATYYSGPAVVTTSMGFGVHATNTGGSVDESRIALVLRERDAPLYLTSDRTSHSEATEWLATIRRFLRTQGWIPLEERDDVTEAAASEAEPQELLVVDASPIRHSLTAVVRHFELVVEARRTVIDGPEAGSARVVIGAEELSTFTDLLLEGSGDRSRYAKLGHHALAIALVRDTFAEPYGVDALRELRAWLEERELPCRFEES